MIYVELSHYPQLKQILNKFAYLEPHQMAMQMVDITPVDGFSEEDIKDILSANNIKYFTENFDFKVQNSFNEADGDPKTGGEEYKGIFIDRKTGNFKILSGRFPDKKAMIRKYGVLGKGYIVRKVFERSVFDWINDNAQNAIDAYLMFSTAFSKWKDIDILKKYYSKLINELPQLFKNVRNSDVITQKQTNKTKNPTAQKTKTDDQESIQEADDLTASEKHDYVIDHATVDDIAVNSDIKEEKIRYSIIKREYYDDLNNLVDTNNTPLKYSAYEHDKYFDQNLLKALSDTFYVGKNKNIKQIKVFWKNKRYQSNSKAQRQKVAGAVNAIPEFDVKIYKAEDFNALSYCVYDESSENVIKNTDNFIYEYFNNEPTFNITKNKTTGQNRAIYGRWYFYENEKEMTPQIPANNPCYNNQDISSIDPKIMNAAFLGALNTNLLYAYFRDKSMDQSIINPKEKDFYQNTVKTLNNYFLDYKLQRGVSSVKEIKSILPPEEINKIIDKIQIKEWSLEEYNKLSDRFRKNCAQEFAKNIQLDDNNKDNFYRIIQQKDFQKFYHNCATVLTIYNLVQDNHDIYQAIKQHDQETGNGIDKKLLTIEKEKLWAEQNIQSAINNDKVNNQTKKFIIYTFLNEAYNIGKDFIKAYNSILNNQNLDSLCYTVEHKIKENLTAMFNSVIKIALTSQNFLQDIKDELTDTSIQEWLSLDIANDKAQNNANNVLKLVMPEVMNSIRPVSNTIRRLIKNKEQVTGQQLAEYLKPQIESIIASVKVDSDRVREELEFKASDANSKAVQNSAQILDSNTCLYNAAMEVIKKYFQSKVNDEIATRNSQKQKNKKKTDKTAPLYSADVQNLCLILHNDNQKYKQLEEIKNSIENAPVVTSTNGVTFTVNNDQILTQTAVLDYINDLNNKIENLIIEINPQAFNEVLEKIPTQLQDDINNSKTLVNADYCWMQYNAPGNWGQYGLKTNFEQTPQYLEHINKYFDLHNNNDEVLYMYLEDNINNCLDDFAAKFFIYKNEGKDTLSYKDQNGNERSYYVNRENNVSSLPFLKQCVMGNKRTLSDVFDYFLRNLDNIANAIGRHDYTGLNRTFQFNKISGVTKTSIQVPEYVNQYFTLNVDASASDLQSILNDSKLNSEFVNFLLSACNTQGNKTMIVFDLFDNKLERQKANSQLYSNAKFVAESKAPIFYITKNSLSVLSNIQNNANNRNIIYNILDSILLQKDDNGNIKYKLKQNTLFLNKKLSYNNKFLPISDYVDSLFKSKEYIDNKDAEKIKYNPKSQQYEDRIKEYLSNIKDSKEKYLLTIDSYFGKEIPNAYIDAWLQKNAVVKDDVISREFHTQLFPTLEQLLNVYKESKHKKDPGGTHTPKASRQQYVMGQDGTLTPYSTANKKQNISKKDAPTHTQDISPKNGTIGDFMQQ